jgi:1,4-alpha-glucan branching enzyme
MTTGTTVSYATKRFREHLDRFRKLAEQIEWNKIDLSYLTQIEGTDFIFPNIDFSEAITQSPKKSILN